MDRRRLMRRGRGTLYRRLQSLRFLVDRDRGAVLRFLRSDAIHLSLAARLRLMARFVHITNQVRAYHTQTEMLAVSEAILARAGQPGLTVVECGAGKGASTAKLSLATRLAGGRLIVFDSFRGLPANDERHEHLDGRPMLFRPGAFHGRLREVQRAVAAFGAPEVVEYRKGWFAGTLPGFDQLADVVLLDVDLLASTRTCLVHLAPRLRPGGVIFTQDGHLRAIAALLADPTFWRAEVGVVPPHIPLLGREKFLTIRVAPPPPQGGWSSRRRVDRTGSRRRVAEPPPASTRKGLPMVTPLTLATSIAVLLAAAGSAAGQVPADLQQRAQALFGTLPPAAEIQDNPLTGAKITLGRMLYFDPRLSASNTISCNSCHQLDRFGVDGEPTSPGHKGERGERNSPIVYNAAFHFVQFWDGRAATVEEQAKGPILNPVEMGMPSEAAVIDKLRAIPGYTPLFAAAFPSQPEPITYDNIALAIGAFERKLATPAPFDRYLAGDATALTGPQQLGLAKFIDSGCIICHTGPLLGGSMYQKLGLVKPYPSKDTGRAKLTNNPADQHIFKVPSLRNVAETGPYFHDGSLKTLPEAVKIMGEYQLGRQLSDQDVAAIVAFLDSLTGTVDPTYTAAPKLPQ